MVSPMVSLPNSVMRETSVPKRPKEMVVLNVEPPGTAFAKNDVENGFSYTDNFSHDEDVYLGCFIFSRDRSPR